MRLTPTDYSSVLVDEATNLIAEISYAAGDAAFFVGMRIIWFSKRRVYDLGLS